MTHQNNSMRKVTSAYILTVHTFSSDSMPVCFCIETRATRFILQRSAFIHKEFSAVIHKKMKKDSKKRNLILQKPFESVRAILRSRNKMLINNGCPVGMHRAFHFIHAPFLDSISSEQRNEVPSTAPTEGFFKDLNSLAYAKRKIKHFES